MRPEKVIAGFTVVVIFAWINEWYSILFLITAFFIGIFALKKFQNREADEQARRIDMSAVDRMDGIEFENYVGRLLVNEGYSNVVITKGSGDNGVDIFATKLTQRYAIQVKRYQGTVSRSAVSDAVAGQHAFGCNGAMVITNSRLSPAARHYALKTGCELVERETLVEWIGRYQESDLDPRPDTNNSISKVCSHQPATPLAEETLKSDTLGPKGSQVLSRSVFSEVPNGIHDDIKRFAAKEFPKDYSMQMFIAKEQLEAYRELSGLCSERMPPEAFQLMRKYARAAYPDDYSMQLYTVYEQRKSWLTLSEMQADDMPIDIFVEILQEAKTQFPDDFAMQLYSAEEQIAAYRKINEPKNS